MVSIILSMMFMFSERFVEKEKENLDYDDCQAGYLHMASVVDLPLRQLSREDFRRKAQDQVWFVQAVHEKKLTRQISRFLNNRISPTLNKTVNLVLCFFRGSHFPADVCTRRLLYINGEGVARLLLSFSGNGFPVYTDRLYSWSMEASLSAVYNAA